MAKSKLPDTSHSANKAMTLEMRKTHWSKIIKALQVLGVASMEKIASHLTMDLNQVSRRMVELEREGIVCKPSKTKTKSGRACYQYQLTGVMPKTENEVKLAQKEEIKETLKTEPKKPKFVEQTLF